MVQTCGIPEKFKIVRLSPTNAVENFDCGNNDLNDYITNRASLFDQYMLAASYTCIDSDTKLASRFYSTFILTHSLRYLNGNGITVNCSFLTKDTFINVKSLSKNSGALPYGSIVRILAAL